MPTLSYYDDSRTFGFIAAMFGTKSHAWKHEEEWRLVLVGQNGYVRIPEEMIDAVVFGMRTSPDHEQTVRTWIRQRSQKADLLRVVHRPKSFELELVGA